MPKIISSDNRNLLSVDMELIEIDSGVGFVNYHICRTNEVGSFNSLVEEYDELDAKIFSL